MSDEAKPFHLSVSKNRKARHDYTIEDSVEAGVVLVGSEVKALRAGEAQLDESFVHITPQGNALWVNGYIPEYKQSNRFNHDPRRPRGLLLHKRELEKLRKATARKGYTLVPLELLFRGRWVKLVVGLGKGRKEFDKRQVAKDREAKREMDRAHKSFNR